MRTITGSFLCTGLLAGAVALLPARAGAQYLFNNLNSGVGSPVSLLTQDGGMVGDSFSTGDYIFTLMGVQLTLEDPGAPAFGNIYVQLLSDNSGSPGDNLVNVGPWLDASQLGDPQVYNFHSSQGITLTPNTQYWIVASADSSVNACWDTAAQAGGLGTAGEYWDNDNNIQSDSTGPLLMQVYGVPEPTSLALLGAGASVFGLTLRRKSAAK